MRTTTFYQITFPEGGRNRTMEFTNADLAEDMAKYMREKKGKRNVSITIEERTEL